MFTPQSATAPSPHPTATPLATVAPTSPPATVLPLAEGIARQELNDQRAQINQLWSVIYLYKAVNQLTDAEALLRANDLQNVDQSLIAADDSLALAYDQADQPDQNPIKELRRQIGVIHSDVFIRPEGLDERLAQLRQTMLALIDEHR